MSMRDITHVIDNIIARMPASEYNTMIMLCGIKETAWYTPPECVRDIWGKVTNVLRVKIGYPPTQDWHWEVLCIFMDKPISELKEKFK